MPDPLNSVLRIRRITLDDARRGLTAALQAEETARLRADEAEALIEQEAENAADLLSNDQVVETFAVWLPVGRANAVAARAKHDQLRSQVARARVAVALARAATETAQNLLARQGAEQAMNVERHAQAVLDDFTSRPAISAVLGHSSKSQRA